VVPVVVVVGVATTVVEVVSTGVTAGIVVAVVVALAPTTVGVVYPYFWILAPPAPPILPNTPNPNNNPKINANNAKIPNIGHNHAGHPPFFYFLLSRIGVASTFEPLLDTLAG